MDSVGSVSNVVDVELVVIGGAIAEKLGPELADRIAREACPRILLPGSKLKYVVAAFGTTPASSAPHPSGAPV